MIHRADPHRPQAPGESADAVAEEGYEDELLSRAGRKEALARLAAAALRGGEPSQLMEEALRELAPLLQAQRLRAMELLPGGDRLRVAAAVGWDSADPGRGDVIPYDPGSWIGQALRSGPDGPGSASAGDVGGDREARGREGPATSSEASRMCAVVPGANGPWGVLEVYAGESSALRAEEADFLCAVVGLLGVALERARGERLLQETAERLQALSDGNPTPTYTWRWNGADFALEGFNEAARRSTEGRIQGWLGTTAGKMYGDRPDILESLRRTLAEKKVIREEIEYRFRDTDRTGSFVITFVYVPPDTVIVHTEDITARRRTEEALRRQAQVLEQIHEAVVITDLDGVITGWNAGAERLMGYAAHEALGRHVSLLYDEERRLFLEQEIIAPLKAKGIHQVDVQMRDRTGRQFHGRLFLSLLRDGEGRPTGMVGYTIDDSERVEAARSLTATVGRLEVLNAIGRSIAASRSPRVIAEIALQGLARLVPFSGGDLLLFDRSGQRFRPLAARREDPDLELGGGWLPADALGRMEELRQGETQRVRDSVAELESLDPALRRAMASRKMRSLVRAPLLARGRLLGLLSVGSEHPGAFTEEHVEAVRGVAGLAAISIRQARLIAELRARRRQLQRLGRRLVAAREIERREVSRTLHEDAAQVMSAQKMSLQLMAADTPESLGSLKARLAGAIRDVESLLARTRLLAYWLRPPALDVLGLDASLEGMSREFTAGSGLQVEYSGQGLGSVPEPVAVTLYRLLQEALADARRREARACQVRLSRKKGVLALTVADDGRGVGAEGEAVTDGDPASLSEGLAELRELLRLFHGDVRVDACRPQGRRLAASVPLRGSTAASSQRSSPGASSTRQSP